MSKRCKKQRSATSLKSIYSNKIKLLFSSKPVSLLPCYNLKVIHSSQTIMRDS